MKHTKARILQGITPASVGIMGSRVLLSTYKREPKVLAIDSEDIAESFTFFFETLWKQAKPLP